MLTHYSTLIGAAAAGLSLIGQFSPANADVLNTYNGIECVKVTGSGNLFYGLNGFVASGGGLTVSCPIVKFLTTTTGTVTVNFAATGGTSCNLVSYDVFNDNFIPSGHGVVPGSGTQIAGRKLEIASSNRGAMLMTCNLISGGRLLNYLVREHS